MYVSLYRGSSLVYSSVLLLVKVSLSLRTTMDSFLVGRKPSICLEDLSLEHILPACKSFGLKSLNTFNEKGSMTVPQ